MFKKLFSRIAIGLQGEKKAAKYLTKKGYRIAERNMRTPFGEVDIIAFDGTVMVFVEVKKRSSKLFGTGLEAVTGHKRQNLIKSAQYYCKRKNIMPLCRFDVISIDAEEITHVENAFTA